MRINLSVVSLECYRSSWMPLVNSQNESTSVLENLLPGSQMKLHATGGCKWYLLRVASEFELIFTLVYIWPLFWSFLAWLAPSPPLTWFEIGGVGNQTYGSILGLAVALISSTSPSPLRICRILHYWNFDKQERICAWCFFYSRSKITSDRSKGNDVIRVNKV